MAGTLKISLPEAELIAALRRKEKVAMQVLYDMYHAALYGVISKIVQHDEIAEDLLQDTFVRIWNSIAMYDESKGRLFTWMVNIARNISIDKLRSKDFRNAAKNQDIENNVDAIEGHIDLSYNPETLGVKELVVKLKPELRSVLELVYFNGFTHIEAAEELNIPLGTLKTRIRAAILELRKKFN